MAVGASACPYPWNITGPNTSIARRSFPVDIGAPP